MPSVWKSWIFCSFLSFTYRHGGVSPNEVSSSVQRFSWDNLRIQGCALWRSPSNCLMKQELGKHFVLAASYPFFKTTVFSNTLMNPVYCMEIQYSSLQILQIISINWIFQQHGSVRKWFPIAALHLCSCLWDVDKCFEITFKGKYRHWKSVCIKMAAVKWTGFFCCAEVKTKQYKLMQFGFQFPD